MGVKRVRIHTNLQPQKCGKGSSVGEEDDRISQLPDEILVDILSLLSLKEAARTSVLSSRWKTLWKHTPSLNFDSDKSLYRKFLYQEELLKSEKRKYVKWVNSVIRSHESLTLQEFSIDFHLSKSSRNAITRWLEFAFSRQVQRLELNFRNGCNLHEYYRFPDKFLTLSSCTSPKLQPPSDSFCIHHRPGMCVGFKSLKALVFRYVGVSDGDVQFFLRNCPLLEQLIVHNSGEISELEVSGSSLKLKHLEIVRCSRLKSLKVVSVPRLTTLSVPTNFKGLLLENVPMLVNVSVRCFDRNIAVKPLFDVVLSCCTSRLETLHLEMFSINPIGEHPEFPELPEMPKLKKLVIRYDAFGHESLTRLAALIRVSPYLEEFVLLYNWSNFPRKDREVRVPMRSPHHHLKVFKFRSYYGSTNDVELLSYILENCVALEKITVDVDPYSISDSDGKLEVAETARKNAKQKLAPQVPQHIELVIL